MTALAEMTTRKTREPERRCIVSGETAPKHGLIRFVVGPDNVIVPDLGERLPGRGIWLSADAGALKTAVAKKLFARAAKAQVSVPDDLADRVEALLVQRCRDIIGLARRSDLLVFGYDRVLEVLERNAAGLVVIAADAGGARHDVIYAARKTPIVSGLKSSEMGEAAGKGVVSFLTIQRGGLAESLKRECERLTGLRPGEMDVSK
ncbi:MAG: RNA-binding protein [Rhodospirillales bacterium]|nr:RNA-binding protein [Rhodospirillales bacterium]MBO6787545.1 RNA-binding protein [Rhodospirillales bacterium]